MKKIVIVGGGFAGATLARHLACNLPSGWEAVLISEEAYTTYNPMLPEVVGGSIFPEQVVAPLREVINVNRSGQFIMARVTRIDPATRTLHFASLSGDSSLVYDQLVLAFGNRARLDIIPGLEAHSLPVKTVGDAIHVRNLVLRRLAQMELENDMAKRARLGHFVVIGGGFSGVEVAGAIADYVRGARRYFRRVMPAELKVSIIQNIDRLLPELPPKLGIAAQRILKIKGVDVLLSVSAAAVSGEGVTLKDGTLVASESVICTIGTRPNPLLDTMGLALERGRVVVGPAMDVPTHPEIWALGDCAAVMNARDAAVSPPTAQFAVRQAKVLARNILDRLAGREPKAFSYRPRGSMAAIGHMCGVADVFGVPLAGLPAWLVWRAYYLLQMPTLGRKVRIFVEWTWGMLFSADITHLRFTRSVDQESL